MYNYIKTFVEMFVSFSLPCRSLGNIIQGSKVTLVRSPECILVVALVLSCIHV